jgi:putative transposase
VRTIQRWERHPEGDDQRCGPRHRPGNALSAREEAQVLALLTSAESGHLSPKQLVPAVGRRRAVSCVGIDHVSATTPARIEDAAAAAASHGSEAGDHRPSRGASEPGLELGHHVPPDRDPRAVSSSLPGHGRLGRRIVGWEVHDDELAERAATLIHRICAERGVDPHGLVLHSDNGKPMRGNTMIATLQWLGIVPSFWPPTRLQRQPVF